MKSYETLRKEAWDFYSQIGSVTCPTLNNERIIFSRAGFNHILKKGRTPRPKKDQIRRFKLLPYAKEILQGNNATVLFRKGETARFWEIATERSNLIIRVIVRQKKGGLKHFFSIMDNNVN